MSGPRRRHPALLAQKDAARTTDNPADTVREALTRVTSILLDLEDQLARGDGEYTHPRAWTAALDDFHAVLVELTKLAVIVSSHHDRWARTHPTADHADLTGAAGTVDALSHAWDALTEAITAIGTARASSVHQPADVGDKRKGTPAQ